MAGCDSQSEKNKISQYDFGSQTLHIPDEFGQYERISVDETQGSFKVYFPGNVPLPAKISTLLKSGNAQYSISVLFSDLHHYPDTDLDRGARVLINQFDDALSKNEKYALILYSQPEKPLKSLDDVYIENVEGRIASYIVCRKAYDDTIIPQCVHYFIADNISYDVRYDKRLLPEWKKIQNNISSLVHGFKSNKISN